MKELYGEVFPKSVARILPKYPAMFTHGIPGLAIGGIVIGAFVVNHVVATIWSQIPELVSIGLLIFGLAWLYSLIRGISHNLFENDNAASYGMLFSVIITIVGFISFFASWVGAHPGPPAPVIETSCENHSGLRDRVSRDNDGRAPFYITCNDGYTFEAL